MSSMRSFFSLSIRASSSLLSMSDFKRSFFLFCEDALEILDGATLVALLIIDLVSWSCCFYRGGFADEVFAPTGGFLFADTA